MARVGITTEPPATKALSCFVAQEKEALFFCVFDKHRFRWFLMGGNMLFFYEVISLEHQQKALWHG
jgi:hypothetical protein